MQEKAARAVTANPKRPYGERQGRLMTPAEAGDYLGVTERQIRRLTRSGQLPFVYVGSLVRVSRADLDRYIQDHRVPPEKD